ncbi:hypothetical protein FRC02_000338 [Tulasnella sp. 418]|nr:hypothetical protein FRC02_000338 [Tulasnella sp. 418]
MQASVIITDPYAARIARTLIQDGSVGTMMSVYPESHQLAGQPFGLMEYYAPCYNNGSLLILYFSRISQNGRNIQASSNHSASFAIQSPPSYSLATKPRVSLIGTVTILEEDEGTRKELAECYAKSHPDSKWWLPGGNGGVHDAVWAIFDPHTIYFVGGFGGLHYIGYIPPELYQSYKPASGGRTLLVNAAESIWRYLFP